MPSPLSLSLLLVVALLFLSFALATPRVALDSSPSPFVTRRLLSSTPDDGDSDHACGYKIDSLAATYDLNPIKNRNKRYVLGDAELGVNSVKYIFRVCQALIPTDVPDECKKNPSVNNAVAVVYRVLPSGNTCEVLGVVGKRENRDWQPLIPAHRNGGVVLSYSGGDKCPSGSGSYSINYKMICAEDYDENEELTFPFAAYPFNGSCQIDVIWPSKQGCPIVSLKKSLSDRFAGYSYGWVFIFVLLTLVTLYAVGGVLYNMFSEGKGFEDAFPDLDMWRSLPSLVTEGCRYFVYRVKLLGSANRVSRGSTYGAVSEADQDAAAENKSTFSAPRPSSSTSTATAPAAQGVTYGQGVSYQDAPEGDW